MSQLRKDPISGDWIILATNRSKRPSQLDEKAPLRKPAPVKSCPFEDPAKSGNVLLSRYPAAGPWRIAVIPNKYPALARAGAASGLPAATGPLVAPSRRGLYEAKAGVGIHELIITRDHDRFFYGLKPNEAAEVLAVFQERYRAAQKTGQGAYALGFMNYGPSVGASIWHPHFQFLSLPFVPPHIAHSLAGARAYFKKNKRCARCDIIKEEKKERKRIIAENAHAIAFAPYVSKRPFEVSVMPKRHAAEFEKTPAAAMRGVAEVLQSVLGRIKKYANDPDVNFFIHSAPFDGAQGRPFDTAQGRPLDSAQGRISKYDYHHWHIEVYPYFSRLGGFEFGTGIYINIVDPDDAAGILRGGMRK